ncbi:MAG TPA: GxxExxY protein [Planctomycetota bacterium]|nr:GxxExxY protein [Planctomycetota bacterium]
MDDFIYKELSYKIMEAVFEVHNILGPGYPEDKYEKALCKEFRDRDISYETQKLAKLIYKDEDLGDFRLDLVVEGKIILELKAVSELNEVFEAQTYSYLKATGLKLGILINFGKKMIEYKRIVN